MEMTPNRSEVEKQYILQQYALLPIILIFEINFEHGKCSIVSNLQGN